MSIKIVSDSSSNVYTLEGANYSTVPMKVIAGDREYVDTPALDVLGMVRDLKEFKGNDAMVAPSVLAALGNCYVHTGNDAQAAATLIKAAHAADNNLLSPAYLIQAGQIFEKLGKNTDALKAYQEVKDKYYGSTLSMNIDMYIERVK